MCKVDVYSKFREQLADLQVKFSPKAASRVLNQWIVSLNETLQSLHTAMFQQKIEELKVFKLQRLEEDERLTESLEADQREKINTEPQTGENFLSEHISNRDDGLDDGNDQEQICDKNTDVTHEKDESSIESVFSKNNGNENSKDVEIDSSEVSAICDIIESTIHLFDPFYVTSEMHDDMAKLAILCFQHKVHGNPSKYLSPRERVPEDTPHLESTITDSIQLSSENKTTTKAIVSTVVSDSREPCQKDGPEVLSRRDGDLETKLEQFEKLTGVSNPMKEDKEIGHLLKCHFHLFRNAIGDVMKVIRRSNHPKDHRWNAFLECLAGITCTDLSLCR